MKNLKKHKYCIAAVCTPLLHLIFQEFIHNRALLQTYDQNKERKKNKQQDKYL